MYINAYKAIHLGHKSYMSTLMKSPLVMVTNSRCLRATFNPIVKRTDFLGPQARRSGQIYERHFVMGLGVFLRIEAAEKDAGI